LALVFLTILLWNPLLSLLSFRKISDFPLYQMHLYGDDGLARYLEHGEQPGRATSILQPAPAWACTVFAALTPAGDPLLGRNFDWYTHPALILFTHPADGYDSVSLVDISYLGFDLQPPKFKDIFLLDEAPLLPFDGMNEAGLAVGMMAVPHGEANLNHDFITIDSLVVIRLLLDRAATVDEAIALMGRYNVDFGNGPPIHYLIADASGKSVVVEYVDNKLLVFPQGTSVWQVSTNFLLSDYASWQWPDQCLRFRRAAETLTQADGLLTETQAMSLLKDVSQNNTRWSVLYGLHSGQIQLAVGRDYNNILQFNLPMKEPKP
jgi:hypothetical protein